MGLNLDTNVSSLVDADKARKAIESLLAQSRDGLRRARKGR